MRKNLFCSVLMILTLTLFFTGCSKGEDSGTTGSGISYSFTSAANARIEAATRFVAGQAPKSNSDISIASANPTLCTSVICFTPTAVSGIYYGTGLSIQSNGNGMMAYFGQDAWSGITGTSTSYPFSAGTPVVNAGTLTCCVGTGDLASENTYIESVAYLFGYIDVTFTMAGITGNVGLNGPYTLRFVLATGAIPNGVRGDILIFDAGQFKWMNSATDALTTTRPVSPVTMNSSVVNWVNPFDTTKGNQDIPVMGALVVTPADQVMQVNETQLRDTGKTYTFGFNKNNFIMFPTLLHADINMITTLKELLTRVHLAGLPHSSQPMGVGNMADTELVITP